jgi:predicted ABC-type transport system involved in lysophospholipase L1 biosynthesis ATPase subunit
VVKTPDELSSTDQSRRALAANLALSTNLAVVAEPGDGLVDQFTNLLVSDVADIGGVFSVHTESARAILDELVLTTAAGAEGPSTAA